MSKLTYTGCPGLIYRTPLNGIRLDSDDEIA